MDRDAFEQLVSDWLDEPQRADLRARLEAAVAGDPERVRLRDEYVRLEQLIRAVAVEPAVNWAAWKTSLSARIDEVVADTDEDAALDAQLRAVLPDIEQRVDWGALRGRLSQAIDQDVAGRRPLRLFPWRGAFAAGALATAAAVLFWLSFPVAEMPVQEVQPAAVCVQVEVLPPVGVDTDEQGVAVAAQLTVCEESDPEVLALAYSAARRRPAKTEPEVYFMLEPPDVALTMASAGGYGMP